MTLPSDGGDGGGGGSSLVVANAGDCRAVLSRRGGAQGLTTYRPPRHPH